MEGTGADHIISLKDFAVGHHRDHVLLQGINLTVDQGELVALIGRNGTGKTTLLKSMIGLLSPLAGNCVLNGRPVMAYSLPQRARQVSFVSSHLTQLPSLTVSELVSLGRMPYTGWTGLLTGQDRIRVQQALEEVQMDSFRARKLECLSDGERQRAMIARAFVQDTPLMVLDEPTAFLDIPNTFDLIRLLNRFRDQGRSVVYSTHDLETALQCADKLWVIHDGKILEGAPEDLGLSGLFSELFASSGIRYDPKAGRFMVPGKRRGTVSLEGEPEEPLRWTQMVLERLGFNVADGQEVRIRMGSAPEGFRWIVSRANRDYQFFNLYSMARFLTQEQ